MCIRENIIHARTPPAVQSMPVCRFQGRGWRADGRGGGGGLVIEDDDTDAEDDDEGSTAGAGAARETAEEVGHGGGDMFCSSGARGLDTDWITASILDGGGLGGDFVGVRLMDWD